MGTHGNDNIMKEINTARHRWASICGHKEQGGAKHLALQAKKAALTGRSYVSGGIVHWRGWHAGHTCGSVGE